jgi:hypothetical protein
MTEYTIDSTHKLYKMASTIEEMRAIVLDYKTNLEEAQKKLAEMELVSPDRLLLNTEMEAMVLEFETRKAYKSNWKKAISHGLVMNVESILKECYNYFIYDDSGLDPVAVKAQTGELGSRKWQLFVVKVIHYLKQQGCFIRDDRKWNFDTFEDTAGGEDEVTQDAAIYLIEHPEWQPTV